MTTDRIPGWLRESQELAAAADDARKNEEVARLKVRADGPGLWRELQDELEVVVRNLPKGLSGSLNAIPSQSRLEEIRHVQVDYYSPAPRLGWARLWYIPSEDAIRCQRSMLTGKEKSSFALRLCHVNGDLALIVEGGEAPMTAEGAAKYILQPLIDSAITGRVPVYA